MGKNGQNLEGRRGLDGRNPEPSRFFCARCSMALSRVSREFSFRCVFVLILSLVVLLSGISWIYPVHNMNSGFDAKDDIKNSATIQAYFRLQKPVSQLVPHIDMLESEIYEEIGVPNSKVAILSMHQSHASSNWTHVVFGVLSNPMDVPLNFVYESLLKSSLIELFVQQSHLTFTKAIFGQPFEFEILKFPGGITVIPISDSILLFPQILFNFTLNYSISEIEENFPALKDQLAYNLGLRPYEYIYLLLTNEDGSTILPQAIVQASIFSSMGTIPPQRLKQLAQVITNSKGENLGLDNSVFGEVRSVSLSSYLKGTPHDNAPAPAPAPAPVPITPPDSAFSPAPSPYSGPHSLPLIGSSMAPPADSDPPSPYSSSAFAPLAPSPLAQSTSSSSLAVYIITKEVRLLGFCGILIFHLLCWSS